MMIKNTEQTKEKGLELLRMPFAQNQISKLPKPTKAQTDEVKSDYKKGIRCEICGTWHHPKVVHLDYVGHAALTDRLLDADPNWNWEPFSIDEQGLPMVDKFGGMWIKLTICGITRIGYGDSDGKTGGNAVKERIGDALRNAAMRFGAALDLWHKGDLHIDDDIYIHQQVIKPSPKKQTQVKGTISGDPEEGNLSGLINDKPDAPTLKKVIDAYARIGINKDALEGMTGKAIEDWDMAYLEESRELFAIKKEEYEKSTSSTEL
jgi:hypothetical protein